MRDAYRLVGMDVQKSVRSTTMMKVMAPILAFCSGAVFGEEGFKWMLKAFTEVNGGWKKC